ncbi:MAG: IS5 family transposase ISDce1 [Firmicutes bacterium HGW-Firmicutes-8]|nr:MAG: IS5 family transposase ISDce1 [Firmicutes bacterium HGW-Firmicutes-8]
MMGKRDNQMSFSDCWLKGRIPEDSYWHKVRIWTLNHLEEEIFEPLFSNYGRSSVPPVYTFVGILVQFEKGYSDREFEGESRFDDRVKYAITAPRDFTGIDAVTMHDHRARFFKTEVGLKIFAQTIAQAKEAGLFSEENLNVVDTFMVWGAAAKQDTYTLLYQGIKMVLKFAAFHERAEEVKAVLKRDDYHLDRKKPQIDWEDKGEKQKLLQSLVKDALALVSHLKSGCSLPQDLANVCDLLEKVALQDVNIDDNGNVSMINGTAKDRIISVHDSDMRHGHKTTSKKSDGYKSEIITGGEKAKVILGIEVDSANTPDGTHLGDLIDDVQDMGQPINKIYGDCAYSKWEEIEKREQEDHIEFCVKVPSPSNSKGFFCKDQFTIDLKEGTVTCPNGHTKEFDTQKIEKREKVLVKFSSKLCSNCPMKEQCTRSTTGRTININPYEDRLQKQREYQRTPEFKKDYAKRPNVERIIAHLTRHGGRAARYIGKAKVKWQMIMVAINHNIKAITGCKLPQPA